MMPGLRISMIRLIQIRNGMAIMMSTKRMIAMSIRPPRRPE